VGVKAGEGVAGFSVKLFCDSLKQNRKHLNGKSFVEGISKSTKKSLQFQL
jgi:hypothetical protein